METIIVTGGLGLLGKTARDLLSKNYHIIAIDNNFRTEILGAVPLVSDCISCDIRDCQAIDQIFSRAGNVKAVLHFAAQPSHDWSNTNIIQDFEINTKGTLNLLLATERFHPRACFVYTSTNKVYGDRINRESFREEATRYEMNNNELWGGIDTNYPIDASLHSCFGVAKTAADLYVQEFGKQGRLNTVCFRLGCITGKNSRGVPLHGFLSYLVHCVKHKKPYKVIGYKGKQVRDNIHGEDVIGAIKCYIDRPSQGSVVYNLGGGRINSISIIEALDHLKICFGLTTETEIVDQSRLGDHKWWISDNTRFRFDYPNWNLNRTLNSILEELVNEGQ